MLRILVIVGIFAGLSIVASRLQSETNFAFLSWPWENIREQSTASYPMPASGVVQISNSSGDVYVTGGAGSTVDVTVKKSAISRADLDAMSSHVDRADAGLSITTEYPHHCINCDLSYEIKVPRGARIVASVESGDVHVTGTSGLINITSASGDVRLADDSGAVNVDSSSGDVRLIDVSAAARVKESSGDINATGLSNDIDFNTASGDVDARYTSFAHVGTVRIHDTSGSIVLEVPQNFGARITASTSSGDLSSNMKLPIHDHDSGSDVSVSVGSGKTAVDLSASSGDITINSR